MEGNLTHKLSKGFVSLLLRRIVLLGINFATINLILARILPVSYIGIFNIANSILAFFSFFSDIGLAAALIQKKKLNDEDLTTTFTIQEILAFLICVTVILSAPALTNFYNLDDQAVNLIRALGICFFLTTLKVIPSILLERKLEFGPIVAVEIVENLTFNGFLILSSFKGLGVDSFTLSSLIRSIGGLVFIYILSPWRIRLGFVRSSASELLKFGVPFQLNSLLALLKDRLVPLVIARMVGATGVGYITWGQNIAFIPLEIMNIVTRITFPAFSRLQDDKIALEGVLEQSIFFTALFLYPLSFGLMAIAPSLILHVVSSKWGPSLPIIYLFSITALMSTLSTPFTNFLNAIGKIKITLKLMIMWTVLEWLLTPALTIYFNFLGVAIASSIISLTAIIPIVIIKKNYQISIIENTWKQFLIAAIMAVITFLLARVLVNSILSLILTILIGGVVYLGLIYFIIGQDIKTKFKVINV